MWVSSIGRDGKKLGLMLQALDRTTEFKSIQELRSDLPFNRGALRKAGIQLNHHALFPTDSYLDAVGGSGLGAAGQRCYEFQTTTGPLILPGQLLVVALVGATTLMRAPLLSPQGPTSLVTAMCDTETGKVNFQSTPKRMRQFQTDRWSTVCRMNWVLQFPSAAKAWSSVYARALEGVLDIALPNAMATATVRGKEVNGKLMVTGLDMLTLQATEAPFEFAEISVKSGKTWSLIDGTEELGAQRANLETKRLSQTQLQELGNRSKVLWKLLSYPVRVHDVREKIQLVRAHLMTGLPLYLLSLDVELLKSTRVWVSLLQKHGKWDEVAAAIRSSI